MTRYASGLSPLTNTLMVLVEIYAKHGGIITPLEDYHKWLCLKRKKKKTDYLRGLYETTYLRDVIERNHLRNPEGMKELVRVIASGIGSSTNPTRIANTFQSSQGVTIKRDTIKQYIDYLKDSFLIEEALRYDVKGRKYIGTETKYYFADIGIRAAILNYRQQEETHIMENIIYNELRSRGYNVDVGLVELGW